MKNTNVSDERFKEIIFRVRIGTFGFALMGIHFSSEQFADLTDEILTTVYKLFEKGDEEKVKKVLWWYFRNIKCRKHSKYYSKILYELQKEMRDGVVILNGKKYEV
jgi:hypothetical protein